MVSSSRRLSPAKRCSRRLDVIHRDVTQAEAASLFQQPRPNAMDGWMAIADAITTLTLHQLMNWLAYANGERTGYC